MEFFATGIEAVDKLGHLSIKGDVKPRIWHKTIVNENGKPQRLAMDVLAEIVYWYRPEEVRDERTGEVLGWKKKFAGDMLQKDYNYFVENYGESDKTIQRSLAFLEELGVIRRHRKSIRLKSGTIAHNILFIELIYQRLYELTYPLEEKVNKTVPTGTISEEFEIIAEEDDGENADKMGVSTEWTNLSNNSDKNVQVQRHSCPSSQTELSKGLDKIGQALRQNCPNTETEMSEALDRNDHTNTYITTEITTQKTTKNNNMINHHVTSNPIISILEESQSAKKDKIDAMDKCKSYMDIIKENIEYDELMVWFDPEVKQRYDELYQLICDVVCVPRETVRVNGEPYPYELVKSQFLKLRKGHIEYVAECMKANMGKVSNIRAYLITALYNAPTTYCNHVAQEYRTDEHAEYKSDYDRKAEAQFKKMKELKEVSREAYFDYIRRIQADRDNGGDGFI